MLVIDSVNGVEEQTRRLMEVCRMRDTPVIVFINKMDRDGKNRFDLLEEIENELKISLASNDLAHQQWERILKEYIICMIKAWFVYCQYKSN